MPRQIVIPKASRRMTVGWFAEQTFKNEAAARVALSQVLPPEAILPFKAQSGELVQRKDVPGDGIEHIAYHVPHVWGEPSYSIYKWNVTSSKTLERLMSHSGEEVLFAVSGNLHYHFYWTEGAGGEPGLISRPVAEGTMIRILPNVPHHNTSPGRDSSGWMAIRHRSGSTAPIDDLDAEERHGAVLEDVDAAKGGKGHEDEVEGYSLEELEDPTRFLLLLWDIPGKLKVARMRAGLSVAQLAQSCDIHPSYIWRLEKGDTNVSIHTLILIARMVRMDLTDLGLPNYFHIHNEDGAERHVPYQLGCNGRAKNLCQGIEVRPMLARPANYEHWFHPHYWKIDKGVTVPECVTSADFGPDGKSTWIVLKGEITYKYAQEPKVVLEAGSVLHLHNRALGTMKATEDSELLRIEFSAMCSCWNAPEERDAEYRRA